MAAGVGNCRVDDARDSRRKPVARLDLSGCSVRSHTRTYRREMTGWQRAALWGVGLFLTAILAYSFGMDAYDCDGGECDLSALAGASAALMAAFVYSIVAALVELVLAVRRERRMPPPPAVVEAPPSWGKRWPD